MVFNKKYFIILILTIFLISGCKGDTGIKIDIKPAEVTKLTLEQYNGGFFSVKLPKGWVITTAGEYENFGFYAYDPQDTTRKIFFYGNMKYFLKSKKGKQAWATYLARGGYGNAQIFADAPILSPATSAQFFNVFDDFANYANKYGVAHDFPIFSNLEVIETIPRNSPISQYCVDDSILRVLFNEDKVDSLVPCEGLFAASVADTMTTYMYNADAGYYTVYLITGVTAKAEEFGLLKDDMLTVLSSFKFEQSYIDQGVSRSQWGTELALQVGRTLSESADSYNRAWTNRQRANDALSQKRSDSTLGYDRLYDKDTGEVYRAELGFYDEYNTNREKYSNRNLERIPDNNYDLYDKGISGYIYKTK